MKKLDIIAKINPKESTENILTAPFYGKRGSIYKIEQNGNIYIVTRYGVNGNEGEKLITPKRYKDKLIKNYMDDIKKYLEMNWEKYCTSLSEQPKEIISKKKIILSSTVSSTLAITSGVAIILAPESLMMISLPAFFTTFIVSCNELKKLKKYRKEEKEKVFRKQYENLTNKVNEYNIKNTSTKGYTTNYSNIKQDKSNGKIIGDSRKRVLEK